jgi:hypothetical protein
MLNDFPHPWDRSTQPERNPVSNPILFLDEGFISREVVAAAESSCFSANLQWTMNHIENVRFNPSMHMGPFFEARLKVDGSYTFHCFSLSAVRKKKRFNAVDVGYTLSLFTS